MSGTLRRASSVSPAQFEDAPGPGEVAFLAGVAGRGQREELAVERQAGPDHGDGLDRLQRGPRIERGLDVAELEADSPSASRTTTEP